MAKTLKEWFETLPDGIREQAFTAHSYYALYSLDTLDTPCDSLSCALLHGFNWSRSAERHNYWRDLQKAEEAKEIKIAKAKAQSLASKIQVIQLPEPKNPQSKNQWPKLQDNGCPSFQSQ